jgi:hypothetical protein
MRTRTGVPLLLAGLVIFAMFFAGCSGDAPPQGTTTTVPPTPTVQAKFIAGDIIAKSASSADTFWLIVKYDSKTNKYERAPAYKKSDGSWYRKDAKTELYDRTLMERLYPAKVAHVSSISDVPVATPATTTSPTTAPVTTITTAPLPAPTVTGVVPGSGMAGMTVNISSITGTNFRTGATVRLARGSTTITGSDVTTASASNISCRFGILPSAEIGTWNVTVINPDGQSGTFANGFTVTTATTAPPVANFTNITPRSGIPPLTVTFNDISTGSPTSWNWIFGDIAEGNTSIDRNPWHTYTINGTYSVTLTVSNVGGNNTLTLSNYIIVG